jgi:MFS family permease
VQRPTAADLASYGTIMALATAEGLLGYLIGPYLQTSGYDLASIGFVYAVPHAVALLSRMPAGLLYRSSRAKAFLIVGSLVVSSTAIVYVYTPTLPVVAALRAVQGLAFAVMTTVAFAHFLGSHGGVAARGRSMGYYVSAMAVGFSLGSTLGGLVAEGFGYSTAFLTAAGLALVVVVLALWLPAVPAAGIRASEHLSLTAGLRLAIRDPGLLYASLVGFLHNFLFFAWSAFFPLYALAVGLGLAEIGLIRGAFALVNAAVRGICGIVLERMGRRHAVTLGLVCHLLALAAIPLFGTFVPILLVVMFLGVWRAIVLVANAIDLSVLPDPNRVSRGVASGIFHSASDVAGLLAGSVGGALATVVGLNNLFWLLPAAGLAIYFVFGSSLERAARTAAVGRVPRAAAH